MLTGKQRNRVKVATYSRFNVSSRPSKVIGESRTIFFGAIPISLQQKAVLTSFVGICSMSSEIVGASRGVSNGQKLLWAVPCWGPASEIGPFSLCLAHSLFLSFFLFFLHSHWIPRSCVQASLSVFDNPRAAKFQTFLMSRGPLQTFWKFPSFQIVDVEICGFLLPG